MYCEVECRAYCPDYNCCPNESDFSLTLGSKISSTSQGMLFYKLKNVSSNWKDDDEKFKKVLGLCNEIQNINGIREYGKEEHIEIEIV